MRCDLCEIAHTPSRVGAHRGRKFRRGQVEGAGRQDRFERKLLEYVEKTGVLTHGAQAPRAENTWGAYGAKSAYGARRVTCAARQTGGGQTGAVGGRACSSVVPNKAQLLSV